MWVALSMTGGVVIEVGVGVGVMVMGMVSVGLGEVSVRCSVGSRQRVLSAAGSGFS